MIDVHTHIIPNVDDGARDIETSLLMIKKEIECGVDTIVFTPHSYLHRFIDKDMIIDKFNLLKGELVNYDIKYYLGQEIYYEADTLEKLKNNKYLTINNTKYILIEFDYDITYDDLVDVIYSIRLLGYEPIIAHIERYNISIKDYYRLKKEFNPLLQVNCEFVLKHKLKALKMIKNKVIDYIASDCHSTNRRKPNLDKVKKILKRYSFLNIDRFN